jgi:DNA-binding CsgD family transcriptional regulator
MRTDDESDWVSRLIKSLGSHSVPPTLTNQQRRVIAGHSVGMTTKEIAEAMGLSVVTVGSHRNAALARLGARNCTHAVVLAIRQGLID